MTAAVKPNRRRRRFSPLTDLRAERLRQALTLFEIAQAAGISTHRVSILERALDEASPDELFRLHAAIASLAAERKA